jgi:hypothetical protein
MKTNTSASRRINDIDRAQCMGFDAAYYEAFHVQAPGNDSVSFSYPSISSSDSPRVYVHLNVDSPTVALAKGYVETLASAFGESRDESLLSGDFYVVEPSLKREYRETLPAPDPESSLSDLIDRFRKYPKIGFAERIAARLDYLLDVSREEQPEQAPPAAASLEDFLAFLAATPGLAYPTIVLTPEGNVRAQWQRSRNEHFAVAFHGDADVRFVVFAPDPKHPYKTIRVSGGATLDSLMDLVRPYGVEHWVTDEGTSREPG